MQIFDRKTFFAPCVLMDSDVLCFAMGARWCSGQHAGSLSRMVRIQSPASAEFVFCSSARSLSSLSPPSLWGRLNEYQSPAGKVTASCGRVPGLPPTALVCSLRCRLRTIETEMSIAHRAGVLWEGRVAIGEFTVFMFCNKSEISNVWSVSVGLKYKHCRQFNGSVYVKDVHMCSKYCAFEHPTVLTL